MRLSDSSTTDAAILSRVLRGRTATFSPQTTRDILALDFLPRDKIRMRRLSAKSRTGTLSLADEIAIDNYERVGHLLNILQSKARRSLKECRDSTGKHKTH